MARADLLTAAADALRLQQHEFESGTYGPYCRVCQLPEGNWHHRIKVGAAVVILNPTAPGPIPSNWAVAQIPLQRIDAR